MMVRSPVQRQQTAHRRRLQAAWETRIGRNQSRARRGFPAQRAVRERERSVRVHALIFRRWAAWHGLGRNESALVLTISPWTLGRWERSWRRNRLRVGRRGRRVCRPDRQTRNEILAALHVMGPSVGMPTVQAAFPSIARRELNHLLRRFRGICLRKSRDMLHTLSWRQPGRVWAMDYTEPPTPIDGIYGYILAVRDLPSGMALLALPTQGATSQSTQDALAALFCQHGAPLVIKSDNDSAFTAAQVSGLLADWSVFSLLSPLAMPQYNGACEAGIGALKVRAHYEAARNGRPGVWTSDDLEVARLMGNATVRASGPAEASPQMLWRARAPISAEERRLFAHTIASCKARLLEEKTVESLDELSLTDQAAVRRQSTCRALTAHGILLIKRRRISLPINASLRARIT